MPASMAASTTARLCSASMRDPNAFVPRPTVDTIRPLLPRGRYVMSLTVVKLAGPGRSDGSGGGLAGSGVRWLAPGPDCGRAAGGDCREVGPLRVRGHADYHLGDSEALGVCGGRRCTSGGPPSRIQVREPGSRAPRAG